MLKNKLNKLKLKELYKIRDSIEILKHYELDLYSVLHIDNELKNHLNEYIKERIVE